MEITSRDKSGMRWYSLHKPRLDIGMVLFLKPIIDIFWQLSFLDFFLCLLIVVEFGKIFCRRTFSTFNVLDLSFMVTIVLYSITLFSSFGVADLTTYIKIITAYPLYFIGKNAKQDTDRYISSILSGYKIAFIINLVAIALGKGGVQWGNANTLNGLYFFKTDYAVALCTFISFLLIQKRLSLKIIAYIVLAGLLLLLTNARVSLFAMILVILFGIFFRREIKKNKTILRINLKAIGIAVGSLLAMLFLLRYLGTTNLFASRGLISVDFRKITDIFNNANTQGRSVIWSNLMKDFNRHGFLVRLFGVKINNNLFDLGGLAENVGAHSLYFGMLYSIGYIGILLFFVQLLFILNKLNKCKRRELFYLSIMLLAIYLIFGISVCTNEFTNYTWIMMFVIGLAFNKRNNDSMLGTIFVGSRKKVSTT